MRLLNFLINRWRLIYGIGLGCFILYATITMVGEPSSESDTIIYTPIMIRAHTGQFMLFEGFFLVLGAVLYGNKRRDWYAGMLMVVMPLAITGLMAQPAIGDMRLGHSESIRVRDSVYNLARYHLGQFVVYECDSLGIVCHAIYRGGAVVSLAYKEECPVSPRWEIGEDTISMVIQCKTVFTHRVPQ